MSSIRSESDGSTNRNHAAHQKNPERLAGQAPDPISDSVVKGPRVLEHPGATSEDSGVASLDQVAQDNHSVIRYRNRGTFSLKAIASALALRVVGIGAKQ